MRRKIEPLLCELHAHTRWSDGELRLPELVDLYGRNGFDVLAVTDHVVREDDPWRQTQLGLRRATFADYLAETAAQAERARLEYDLLLIPGVELTYNDPDPFVAAHAVAIGCRSFVGVDDGLNSALVHAREKGAALVAAHPYRGQQDVPSPARATQRFSRDWRARAAGRPLEALQPERAVRLGRRPGLAGGRLRRLPPDLTPLRLEDAPPVCEGGAGRDRVSALSPAGVPDAHRRGSAPPRSLSR
jgi:PHP domain